MPYAVKSSYFGQVYQIGSIQNGKAILVPVDEVATGVPCVVKANGNTIKEGSVKIDTSTKPTVFSLWDNTTMQAKGNFDGYTWTATDIYNNTINPDNLTFIEGKLENLEFTASIENNAVARYWAQHPDYKAEDESCIKNYYKLSVYNSSSRRDKPNPILVPVAVNTKSSQTVTYWQKDDKSDKQTVTVAAGKNVAEIYDDNFIPGTTYNYESSDKKAKGKFTVGGTLRMMNIGTNVVNMRDLGGKKGKDGKYVKYGKLYRSAEFKGSTYNISNNEKNALVALGISAEIDLRNTDGGTSRAWIPNLVNNDNYFYAQNGSIIANGPGRMYESSTINLLKNEFAFLVANLRKGRVVQYHCRIGADRTGLFSFLILGILGVSEADILRDYETTSYSSAGLRTKEDGDGDGAASNYKKKIPEFRKTASTFIGAFEKYFLETLKVSQTDIDDFRKLMLSDDPTPSGIDDVVVEDAEVVPNYIKGTFNLAGQRVSDDYKGFVIRDGKKYYVK